MVAWISALLIGVAAFLTPLRVTAEERHSRSIFVVDQSDLRGPFYSSVFSGFRSVLSADHRSHITLYTSTIAHELNQPLGAILTNTETAELILVFRLSLPLALS
jgi:signal transduction histidine kinase